jgi:hypothetical protein
MRGPRPRISAIIQSPCPASIFVYNFTTPTRRTPAPGPQQVRSTRCVIKEGENDDLAIR